MGVEEWTVGRWVRSLLTAAVFALLLIAFEAVFGWVGKALVTLMSFALHSLRPMLGSG